MLVHSMSVCLIGFEITIKNVAVCVEKSPFAICLAITPFTRILRTIKPSLSAYSVLKLAVSRNLARVVATIGHLEIVNVVEVVLRVHTATFAA